MFMFDLEKATNYIKSWINDFVTQPNPDLKARHET